MMASLLILYDGHGGLAQEGAWLIGAVGQGQGYRVRALSFDGFAPTDLERERRVLFVLAPPLATGLFGAAGAWWHQVVRHASFDFGQVNFSVLVLGPNDAVEPCLAGRDLERALRRQQARRVYPRMECRPDDEISQRVWLCGALAALGAVRSGSPAGEISNRPTAPMLMIETSPENAPPQARSESFGGLVPPRFGRSAVH